MGILYIIATPIGNLKDITLRALEALQKADLIVCEDTRQTLKLLNHYGIHKPLICYFQHSRLSKIEAIAEHLRAGKKLALVTDAGTPGIADPGNKLITGLLNLFPERIRQQAEESKGQAIKFYPSTSSGHKILLPQNIKIIPIPGPCAAIAALSVSGLPTDKFLFLGFPPHKKGRNKFFAAATASPHTVVFYESCHRIEKTLSQLAETAPNRQIIVGRELTKQFETIYRGTVVEILAILQNDKNNLKGEFVIIIKN